MLVGVERLLALAEVDKKRAPVGITQFDAVVSLTPNRRTQSNQAFGLQHGFLRPEMELLSIAPARRAI